MFYEGSVEAFSRTDLKDSGVIYTPRSIVNKIFVFDNAVVGRMSDAEIAWARIDEQSVRYPWASALRSALVCLESIATISVDALCPSLETMMLLRTQRIAQEDGYLSKANLAGIFADDERKAASAALRYEDALKESEHIGKNFTFSKDILLEVHRRLMREEGEDSSVHFRSKPFRPRFSFTGSDVSIYVPPEPYAIPPLIDDLMLYCNSIQQSPVTQAAIAHFQLEAIMPFKSGMDRTGRALVHIILRKRKFSQHLIPPIALVPAADAQEHAELLFPYRTGVCYTEKVAAQALNNWVLHCAACIEQSVSVTRFLWREIDRIERSWHARVKNTRRGTALGILLDELPGWPIITVASAMALTGKSFSACNDAITAMQSAQILVPMGKGQRNRCFGSPEILEVFTNLKKATISQQPTPRDDHFTKGRSTSDVYAGKR